MLKMYHQKTHSANTADFWEGNWDSVDFEAAVRACESDPLRPVFDEHVRSESRILEGGCGKGHWVEYFTRLGNDIVGLDFAPRTLVELKRRRANLTLCCANVEALPFLPRTFDVYYSGGVVEHFEAGCESSLAEARRVLDDDGVLLISVPYANPLRRVLTFFGAGEFRPVARAEADRSEYRPGLTYFQYAYGTNEFGAMLRKAGFRIAAIHRYSVIWGLYDLKFLRERADRKVARAASSHAPSVAPSTRPSFIKHLLVGEDTSTFLTRTVTRLMRWSAANMMLFVCRKSPT
jgi:ubiquinone/menaquinone biosynthesis C-methylase UbiE